MRATESLRRSYLPLLENVHAKRLAAVLRTVEALLEGSRLSLTALGRAMPGTVSSKHCIKAVDRLLGNAHLHAETDLFFRALAQVLVGDVALPAILVDWTPLNDDAYALVAAVPLEGRALPIYLEAHGKEQVSDPQVERGFLEALREVLPEECKPVIITDAGFRNPWTKAVVELGWHFITRTSANVLVTDDNEDEGEWVRASTLHARATRKPTSLGVKKVAKTNPTRASLVLYKERRKGRKHSSAKGNPACSAANRKCRQRARDPWLLSTSLHERSAKRIVNLYRTRMQIEESFRDAKNHRFGWSFEDARSADCRRLRTLLLIAAIGMLAITLVGRCAEKLGLQRQHQANTVRKRRVLSHFFLGKAIIAREQLDFLTWPRALEGLQDLRDVVRAHALEPM